jgi:hypothetical protein
MFVFFKIIAHCEKSPPSTFPLMNASSQSATTYYSQRGVKASRGFRVDMLRGGSRVGKTLCPILQLNHLVA